jgi:hypothetical protein
MELLLHSTMCLNELHSSDSFTVRTVNTSLAEHNNTTQSCSFLILYHMTIVAASSLVVNFVVQPMRNLTTPSRMCCCSFGIRFFLGPLFSSVFGCTAKSKEKKTFINSKAQSFMYL